MNKIRMFLGLFFTFSTYCEASSLEVKSQYNTFRSVDLDKRCVALMDYLQNFATQFLENKITVTGCAESNGASGPLYSSDFKVTEDPKNTFRIDVTISNSDKAKVRICDTSFNPTFCTNPNANTALVFQSNQDSVPSRDSRIYLNNLHGNAEKILATTYRWVVKKPWNKNIFGMSYEKFVEDKIEDITGLPFTDATGRHVVELSLKPGSTKMMGSVAFNKLPAQSFLDCFGCNDLKCANSITYEFKNKFLTFKNDNKEKFGAGWTIDSPKPLVANQTGWKYMCGASGYSLQSIVLPK